MTLGKCVSSSRPESNVILSITTCTCTPSQLKYAHYFTKDIIKAITKPLLQIETVMWRQERTDQIIPLAPSLPAMQKGSFLPKTDLPSSQLHCLVQQMILHPLIHPVLVKTFTHPNRYTLPSTQQNKALHAIRLLNDKCPK